MNILSISEIKPTPQKEYLMTLYQYISERYLEGTKRFHDVTSYFLVADCLLFTLFVGAYKNLTPILIALSSIVGFAFSIVWFLILYRIEHMRNMRKTQGKALEDRLQKEFGLEFYIFRKEEYDIKFLKQKSKFIKTLQNLQVPHLAYVLPLSFVVLWCAVFLTAINVLPIPIDTFKQEN